MANFCENCGAPIDQTTGLCTKCASTRNVTEDVSGAAKESQSTGFDIEKNRAEQTVKNAEEKAKRKEEKKLAWNRAKKRYAEDIAAKKAVLKKGKKDRKKAKLAAMSTGKKVARVLVKLFLVLLLVGAIVAGGFYAAKNLFADQKKDNSSNKPTETTPTAKPDKPEDENGGSIDVYNPPTGTMPDEYKPTAPNADEYFQQNAEIISVIPATSAGCTEEEAHSNLTGRGFNAAIMAEYTMDGVYSGEKEISATGKDKHPIYTTFFVAESGELWSIFEINGAVFASPVSYNYEHSDSVPVLLAETETVISYDSTQNRFYETKPAESVLDVKVIARIDATTLSTLDVEEVEMYE